MSVEIVLQYSFGCVVFLRSSGIKMSNVEHGALHDMGNDILSIQFTSTDFFVFHVALCSLETLIIHSNISQDCFWKSCSQKQVGNFKTNNPKLGLFRASLSPVHP